MQVLSTDGEQVVTLQDSDIDGGLAPGSDAVTISSYQRGRSGTYVYDLGSERFLRLSEDTSQWELGGPTQPGLVMWDTPVNWGRGATQWVGELLE